MAAAPIFSSKGFNLGVSGIDAIQGFVQAVRRGLPVQELYFFVLLLCRANQLIPDLF